jgi:uncharacterized protein (DUF2147 family)
LLIFYIFFVLLLPKQNKIIMKRLYFILVAALCSAYALANSPIVGDWTTVDDKTGEHKSVVTIYQSEDGLYYGKIVALLGGAGDDVCDACVGEDHNKPVVGLVIVRGMQLKDGELRGGKVLDPDNGKFYYAKIYLNAEGNLVLRGSLDKAGLLGRSQTWLRK